MKMSKIEETARVVSVIAVCIWSYQLGHGLTMTGIITFSYLQLVYIEMAIRSR